MNVPDNRNSSRWQNNFPIIAYLSLFSKHLKLELLCDNCFIILYIYIRYSITHDASHIPEYEYVYTIKWQHTPDII